MRWLILIFLPIMAAAQPPQMTVTGASNGTFYVTSEVMNGTEAYAIRYDGSGNVIDYTGGFGQWPMGVYRSFRPLGDGFSVFRIGTPQMCLMDSMYATTWAAPLVNFDPHEFLYLPDRYCH